MTLSYSGIPIILFTFLKLNWRGYWLVIGLAGFFSSIPDANAVNWLKLQGEESVEKYFRVIGFVQPSLTADFSDPVTDLQGFTATNNGKHIAKGTIVPWLDDQERFHFRRARLGVRGRLPTLTGEISESFNYFVLLEAGSNWITYQPFGDRDQAIALTDLSLTYSGIRGAKLRFGLFKFPGPEELFQTISGFDYIEFSDFVAREMLEVFATGNLAPAPANSIPSNFTTQGTPVDKGYGFGAGRDWGIKIFDSFEWNRWELSYAVMIGNGDAIKISDVRIDNNFDRYLYLSGEYLLSNDSGPKRHGAKFYAWYQSGERNFSSDPRNREFERIRFGFGFKILEDFFGFRQRLAAELNYADGMIFYSPVAAVPGNPLRFAAEEGNRSRGISIDYGIFLTEKFETSFRYDQHDLLYKQAGPWSDQDERILSNFTLGTTYHFTPKIRLTLNYLFRNVKTPHNVTTYAPNFNAILNQNVKRSMGSLGDRIALQLTWIF